MDVVAIGLNLLFAGVALGWRTWVQWRRTGDTGLRVHAPTGSTQWWAKLGFVTALLAGFAAPVAGLAGLDPLDLLDRPALRAAGVGVALVSASTRSVLSVVISASISPSANGVTTAPSAPMRSVIS